MANIRLKELIEANVDPKLVARSKETGKLVYFKSPENKAAALKAGSHTDPKDKKGGEPKVDAKPNSMFGKDYSKDRGAKAAPKDNSNWMDDLDSIDVSDVKGKADPSADSWTHGDVFGATFKDPQTGKPISVGDAYDREDDSPAYQKAFAYVAQFNPDDEAVMGTQAYDDLNKKPASGNSGNYGSTPGPNFQLKTKDDWDKAAKIGLLPIKGPDGKTIENPFTTDKPKADVKSIVKDLLKKGDKEFRGAYKLKDVVNDFKDNIDDTDEDGKELKARLDKGEDGTYVQTDETEGTVVFNDGSQYEFAHVEDGPIPVTKVGKEEPNTSSKLTSMLPNQFPKKASQLTWKDGNTISDILNKEAGLDGITDTTNSSMDPDNNTLAYTASAGDEPTYTLYFGMNDDYGKPDEFRVSLESTYGNDPAKLGGKHDKAFKSPKDAITYMTALGKKYKKEMQMDDSND